MFVLKRRQLKVKIIDEITKPKSLPTSPTFILEREIDCSPKDIKFINALLNDARIIQNTVLAMAKKRYNQMIQSKAHRDLYKELKTINEQIESSPKNKEFKGRTENDYFRIERIKQ